MKGACRIAVLVALAACGGPVEPTGEPEWGDFTLPPPDTILDPSRLRPGEIVATPCAFGIRGSRLRHLLDVHEWMVVDVFLGRSDPEGPWDAPTEQDLDHIEAGGGHVLHRFNVPAARVRIVTSRIPELMQVLMAAQSWPVVRTVPDLSRYDFEVSVGFSSTAPEQYVALFESLGGRVEGRIDERGMLWGVLPDRSVPTLRKEPSVAWVEAETVGCLA